jgi:hypothetical protein
MTTPAPNAPRLGVRVNPAGARTSGVGQEDHRMSTLDANSLDARVAHAPAWKSWINLDPP